MGSAPSSYAQATSETGNNKMDERFQSENQDYGFTAVLNCSLSDKKRARRRPDEFQLPTAQKLLSCVAVVRPLGKK
jgi:hypothetical protein